MANKKQALLTEALKLDEQGYNYKVIGEKLASAGFLSSKTGRPVTAAGVSYLLTRAGIRKRKTKGGKTAARSAGRAKAMATAAEHASTPPRSAAARLRAVRAILEVKALPAEDRVTLATMLLE